MTLRQFVRRRLPSLRLMISLHLSNSDQLVKQNVPPKWMQHQQGRNQPTKSDALFEVLGGCQAEAIVADEGKYDIRIRNVTSL